LRQCVVPPASFREPRRACVVLANQRCTQVALAPCAHQAHNTDGMGGVHLQEEARCGLGRQPPTTPAAWNTGTGRATTGCGSREPMTMCKGYGLLAWCTHRTTSSMTASPSSPPSKAVLKAGAQGRTRGRRGVSLPCPSFHESMGNTNTHTSLTMTRTPGLWDPGSGHGLSECLRGPMGREKGKRWGGGGGGGVTNL
jgi:hypothetical protein